MDTCRICGKEWSTIAPKVHPECVEAKINDFNGLEEAYAEMIEVRDAQAAEIKRLEDENELTKELLIVSKCPNCDGSGTKMVPCGMDDVGHIMGQPEQCQWCFLKIQALKG